MRVPAHILRWKPDSLEQPGDAVALLSPRRQAMDDERLAEYPRGYRFLAYCQEVALGAKVLRDLPGHRIDVAEGTPSGKKHDLLYWQAKTWLDGGDIEF